jgi:hypothetical protein
LVSLTESFQADLQKLTFDEDLIKNSLIQKKYLALKDFNVRVKKASILNWRAANLLDQGRL